MVDLLSSLEERSTAPTERRPPRHPGGRSGVIPEHQDLVVRWLGLDEIDDGGLRVVPTDWT